VCRGSSILPLYVYVSIPRCHKPTHPHTHKRTRLAIAHRPSSPSSQQQQQQEEEWLGSPLKRHSLFARVTHTSAISPNHAGSS